MAVWLYGCISCVDWTIGAVAGHERIACTISWTMYPASCSTLSMVHGT